jgi:hypothetical protein
MVFSNEGVKKKMESLFKEPKINWHEVARRVTRKLKRKDRPVIASIARRVYIGDVLSKPILDAVVAVFAEDKERKAKAEQVQ